MCHFATDLLSQRPKGKFISGWNKSVEDVRKRVSEYLGGGDFIMVERDDIFRHNVKEQTADEIGLSASPCCASRCFQYIQYNGNPAIKVNGLTQVDYPTKKKAPITFWLLSLLIRRLDKLRRQSHLIPTELRSRW